MEDTFYAKAEIKREGKELVGIASTEAEDRHGEIVSIEGWDLKNAKQNCPLLWAHKHDEPAVGTVTRLWVERNKATGTKPRLMFKAFISDATERGRAVKQLIEEGVLKAFSVGFRGLDMVENKFTKQELLEISIVNVPANPDALMLAYKSLHDSGISDDTIKDLGVPVEFVREIDGLKTRLKALETKAKVEGTTAPQVDKRKVTSRLTIVKSMTRRIDEQLAAEKTTGVPQTSRVTNLKILKRASDQLIGSLKQEL